MKKKLLIIAIIVLLWGCSFLITAGIVKLGSAVFGFKYTWVLVFFVWLVIITLKDIFGGKK
jgi:hypothetical protein